MSRSCAVLRGVQEWRGVVHPNIIGVGPAVKGDLYLPANDRDNSGDADEDGVPLVDHFQLHAELELGCCLGGLG